MDFSYFLAKCMDVLDEMRPGITGLIQVFACSFITCIHYSGYKHPIIETSIDFALIAKANLIPLSSGSKLEVQCQVQECRSPLSEQ